jgi:hypothetical protein
MMVDNGGAPCVRNGLLSLAICKPRIRSSAGKRSLIFGFGANGEPMSNRLIYIAKITEDPLKHGKYYDRFRSRRDCIYTRTKTGRLIWKNNSRFHKNGSEAHRDIGFSPDYKKATVLLSRDFRYFGRKGTADYGETFTLIKGAIRELGQGHRVYHRSTLRSQLLALKRKMWSQHKKMKIGRPTVADTSGRCNSGGPVEVC